MSMAMAARAADEIDTSSAGGLSMDESAFRELYDRTSRPLFLYLLRVTRRQDVAEDLLQESYCRYLMSSLPSMDEPGARSYLFRIATNLLRDRWRHIKNESPLESAPEATSTVIPAERKLSVRQALERLKPRERQLLWLAHVEGSSHREIAEHTGLRAASIRLLLFRARRKLADLIDPKGASGREARK
jgi:RNA polymerase sigma-70 factor (ECF subfamily)